MSKRNVLIIEDKKIMADDLRWFAEDEGCECTVCNYADEVMRIWGELGKFDTIVLDLMMRKGELLEIGEEERHLDTGEILFNRIRNEYPDKHIIIITAKTNEDIGVDIDNVPVIYKPLTDDEIEKFLSHLG